MKTAGLLLDFYDDQRGEILKSNCPTAEDLPDLVKEAHILSPEEREVLRDEAFALILHDEGRQLRKFACVDAGNTILSTMYFLENAEKLPAEAIKVAAQNLIAFNKDFGLPVPEELLLSLETGMPAYEKTAVSEEWITNRVMNARVSTDRLKEFRQSHMDKLRAPFNMDDIRHNPQKVLRQIGQDSAAARLAGARIRNPSIGQKARDVAGKATQVGGKAMEVVKKHPVASAATAAGAVGAAALGRKLFKKPEQEKQAAAAPMTRKRDTFKQAYAGDDADWAQRTNLLSVRAGTDTGRILETANTLKTAAVSTYERRGGELVKVSNVIDVSALEPAPVQKTKVAEKTALAGKYALDSYSDVQNAIDFFNDCWTEMPPADRHEFCVKTASRADELGIELPERMCRYGSTEYAPDVEAHLASRRQLAPAYAEVWNALSEKRASIDPDTFVELLKKADESAGLDYEWGGAVCDPYLATFGGKHESEKLAWAWESNQGEELTEEQLRAIPAEKLAQSFEPDFAKAFSLNPTAIFDSMPAEHKTIIANLARG